MSTPLLGLLLLGLTMFGLPAGAAPTQNLQVTPFKVNLSDRVPHMLDLIRNTQLPSSEFVAARSSTSDSTNDTLSTGISLQTLKSLKQKWTTGFNWDKEQASINKLHHFTVKIEGIDVHFVHEVSGNPDAIPIILLHGWPGTFLELVPLIDLLAPKSQPKGKTTNTTFNVVIPSLPGFGFSSSPPTKVWEARDTARVFNKLMTQALGYERYAVHGTDWGSDVGYSMYDQFNTTVRALHLNFLPFAPPTPADIAARNITLSAGESVTEQRDTDWETSGNAYFSEHFLLTNAQQPNTIGLALYDNPVGQLAWIGEKFIVWSDPRRGTGPSLLTNHEILREVSIYYLTRSFLSSGYIYAQNADGFKSTDYSNAKARTDAPLLYTTFKYNIAFWPKEYIAAVGNLVSYKFQDFGGHFPGLDNPAGLADDLRDIGKYWSY
ncbi:Alpha/Beta hydrolase protein [Xylaria arbuscula]|nr:Alpha/Beta hydrolase protein [Xylaria arbuscula]